jgi:hypothetical protein
LSTALITNGTAGVITSGIYLPVYNGIITGTSTNTSTGINYVTSSSTTTSTTCVIRTNGTIYYDGTVTGTVTANICNGYVTTTQVIYSNLQAAKKLAKPNHKPVRSAIKKGLKLISGLGFNDEIKCFMGGSGIEVSHLDSDFKFVLTKDRSVLNFTKNPGYSTPYKLELYTKTNVFVSKLCVYMEGTPVLDQVLGMMMFVKSGDEELILRKANYLGLTKDMKVRDELSIKHPELVEKLKPSFFQSDTDTLNGFVIETGNTGNIVTVSQTHQG